MFSPPPTSLFSPTRFSVLQYDSLKSDGECCSSKLVDPEHTNTEYTLNFLGFFPQLIDL